MTATAATDRQRRATLVAVKEALVTSAAEADRPSRRVQRRGNLAAAAFWLFGSALVALAQPNSARGIAAAGAAAAGLATILVVSRLTQDPDRSYFRSLIGAMVAVSVVGDWLVQRLNGDANGFVQYGLDTRIALPLIVVLLAPLVIRAIPVRLRSGALWRDRALIVRQASPLDWVVGAYALLILPDLLLGFAHHAPKTYIAQDLGLIVFLVFAYVAGRTVSVQAGRPTHSTRPCRPASRASVLTPSRSRRPWASSRARPRQPAGHRPRAPPGAGPGRASSCS